MTSHTPKSLTVAFWILVVALAASVTFTPIRADNDCWWHVKTGKYISENGIPKTDVFSFTASDHKWDNHEWLFQVIQWQSYRLGEQWGLGGWRGVILLTTLVSIAAWAAVTLLVQARVRHWGIACLVGVLAVAIGRRTLYPRPPVVSYLLFVVFLWILYEVRLGRWPRKRLWVLFPLTAIWSNLHGAWMAGLLATAIFVGDGFLRFTLSWWSSSGESRLTDPRVRRAFLDTRAFAFTLIACIVASCLNPFGWRLYLLPGRVMSDLNLVRMIFELRSPDFYYTVAFEMAILLTLGGLALVRRRPFVLPDLLLFLFWGHQGIQHVRHLPMFAIGAAPLIAIVAREGLRELHVSTLGRSFRFERWSSLVLLVIAVGLAGYVVQNPRESDPYWKRNVALLRGEAYVESNFPTAPCDFAELTEIEGRVFNRNTYAGYLIWRLAPERAQVFTDSRFDIFGGKFLKDETLIGMGNEDPELGTTWKEGLDVYGIDWIMIPASEGLHQRLLTSEGWELSYVEPGAPEWRPPWVIWIRKSEETQAMRDRAKREYEGLLTAGSAGGSTQ